MLHAVLLFIAVGIIFFPALLARILKIGAAITAALFVVAVCTLIYHW